MQGAMKRATFAGPSPFFFVLVAAGLLIGCGEDGAFCDPLSLARELSTARPGLKGRLWQLFYFLEAGVLAHRLRRDGVTHLHNHFADSSANVAMLASALSGIPFSFNDLWNRTLSLLQADFSHEGTYTCQVGMRTGGPRLTRDTKVTVIGELIDFHSSYLFSIIRRRC